MSNVMNRQQKINFLQRALRSKNPEDLDNLIVLQASSKESGEYFDPETKNKFSVHQIAGKVEAPTVGKFSKE